MHQNVLRAFELPTRIRVYKLAESAKRSAFRMVGAFKHYANRGGIRHQNPSATPFVSCSLVNVYLFPLPIRS